MSLIKLQGDSEKSRGIYYQVDSTDQPIGVGGMGQVYKGTCVDERTGSTRPVAIKFMYADLPPQAIERARREAAIQLRNDNLIEMLGFIELDEIDGTGRATKHYHVVSELLHGVSLSDILEGKTKDRDGEDVPFAVKMLQDYRNDPEHFARTIVLGVLSGLMALHDAGYIHRDIDPSNIMLTAEGHIKLIDFGIAKQMNNLTTNDKNLTVAGAFMGKPEYAAPELALGDIKSQNQTTDIYAVGILLYQCIVGHTPFEGPRHEILEKQIKSKMPLRVIKDKGLRSIIAIACEKRQELRYQSAAQMRVALEALSGSKRAMSNTMKYSIVAGVVGAIAILAIIVLLVRHKQAVAREQAEQAAIALQIEQQKAEITSRVNSIMERCNQALQLGLDYENDDFELSLMSAYLILAEADSIVMGDADAVKSINLKRHEVVAQLRDSALNVLRTKVDNSRLIDDVEGQVYYQSKVDSIETFIKTYIR
ncbi:MAG: serine/threonine protein kinase [Prevotella sp.]|nr:serine/threonine protein kinase [Prevotella sp.]